MSPTHSEHDKASAEKSDFQNAKWLQVQSRSLFDGAISKYVGHKTEYIHTILPEYKYQKYLKVRKNVFRQENS